MSVLSAVSGGRSAERVQSGTTLFHEADAAIQSVVASISGVDAIINEIAGASARQRDGIEQINMAIAQLDRLTQQNAALGEEAAASASLREQALKMEGVVAAFDVA
jgi:methyl-accepting chemotaxis protein-1 (serine sensor receptor)